MNQKQQGMTVFAFLFTVVSVVIIGVLLMRIIPVYVQDYEVKSSIKALKNLPPSSFTSNTMSNVSMLKDKLINQLSLNGIYDIKPEQIKVSGNQPGRYTVTLDYVVVKSLVYNISLMFTFNNSEEVILGSS